MVSNGLSVGGLIVVYCISPRFGAYGIHICDVFYQNQTLWAKQKFEIELIIDNERDLQIYNDRYPQKWNYLIFFSFTKIQNGVIAL